MKYGWFTLVLGTLLVVDSYATPGDEKAKETKEKEYVSLKVVEDFEKGVDDWDDSMSNVRKKPTVEAVDDAKVGKKGGKICYFAADKGSWTLLCRQIDAFPADGTAVAFWCKSTAPDTKVAMKLSEMKGDHTTYEGHKAEFTVGKEWQKVVLPLAGFEYLWSMDPKSNKKLDKEKVSNLAFEQSDETKDLTIFVDQIEIVKEK